MEVSHESSIMFSNNFLLAFGANVRRLFFFATVSVRTVEKFRDYPFPVLVFFKALAVIMSLYRHKSQLRMTSSF